LMKYQGARLIRSGFFSFYIRIGCGAHAPMKGIFS